ncbi:MAG: V-type ATP synthase subunit I [Planctomycetaceae bacterium]|nr:V-type ATP synthase subunit I [Planctomycetaceae bacterium]
MAIASMQKVMIVAHRSQAAELLAALQDTGMVQILDAERAMISKEWPELVVEIKRQREQEDLIERLRKAIEFLHPYAPKEKTTVFAPLIEINGQQYRAAVSKQDPLHLLEGTETLAGRMDKIRLDAENQRALIERLEVWQPLRIPVEELAPLKSSAVFVGLLPEQHVQEAKEKLLALGAAYETVTTANRMEACVIAALHESASEAQKLLRSLEFEPALFEGLTGTIDENVSRLHKRLDQLQAEEDQLRKKAFELGKHKLHLQILYDHHQNLHERIVAEASAPATDHAVFFEGWVRQRDYRKLEKVVSDFDGCDVAVIQPGEGEEPPVEIENHRAVRPFELITRLYGMPVPTSIDPTVFLAPFFAIFFGLCLNDAGYGLILMAVLAWVLKKARIAKGPFWMLMICAFATMLAGAITGSWFGDSITALLPENWPIRHTLDAVRVKLMLFDPMVQPMTFFALSLGLGYLQIMCGLFIAFFANLAKKDWISGICDQLVWIVHLNSFVCAGAGAAGFLPAAWIKPCLIVALVTSLCILLFTVRSGGWGGRIGMGGFQLFSTVFYMGDVLSYVRLMALGMVGGGFGVAINVLVKLISGATPDLPVIGWVLGAIVFVLGHSFNLAMSTLSAFVHTMRLQFVEFFPKFFTGGGKDFVPLRKKFNYVEVRD